MKLNQKTIYFSLFLIMVIFQLIFPARLIWLQESVLHSGKAFKFKTAPIDPNDPFRGKYITLRFENTRIETENAHNWEPETTIYVEIQEDLEGFAVPIAAHATVPTHTEDYLKTNVRYVAADHISFRYPFNRFYMEESKAPKAEKLYFDAARDSTQIAYALVKIKNGDSVIEDVIVNGKSVKEVRE